MEQLHIEMLIILIAAGFVAAVVDSVVGGGGIISLRLFTCRVTIVITTMLIGKLFLGIDYAI